jgi:RNA polymerase sigma-70 factor (ECF subfamily)
MASLKDCDLVRRTLEGEELAFEVLMERYTPMVLGFLSGKTGSPSDAEDLAQEVFLTAYRGLVNLRASDRVGPWLMSIVRNRLIDHYRASSRRPRLVALDGGLGGEENSILEITKDPSVGPGECTAAAQSRHLILEKIAGLKEKHRSVIYRRLIGEESIDAIARQMGLKESTVRMRWLRGIRILRKTLLKCGIGPEKTD